MFSMSTSLHAIEKTFLMKDFEGAFLAKLYRRILGMIIYSLRELFSNSKVQLNRNLVFKALTFVHLRYFLRHSTYLTEWLQKCMIIEIPSLTLLLCLLHQHSCSGKCNILTGLAMNKNTNRDLYVHLQAYKLLLFVCLLCSAQCQQCDKICF